MRKNQAPSSALIVGVVRNVESSIRIDVERLRSAFSNFNKIEFFVVESNSNDDSIEVLGELASEQSDFSFKTIADPKDTHRTTSLASARNEYLNFLMQIPDRNKPDYVVVADFNNLNKLLTRESVATCWENDEWDVCTANQAGNYYDIWALRHEFWSPNDCWSYFNFLVDLGIRKDRAYSIAINSRMIRLRPNHKWVEVDSAFGGLAIYKTVSLLGAAYTGQLDSGDAVCEHVPLHNQIRNNGFKIFINPGLINFQYTDHSKNTFIRKRFLRFCKHLVISMLRKKP